MHIILARGKVLHVKYNHHGSRGYIYVAIDSLQQMQALPIDAISFLEQFPKIACPHPPPPPPSPPPPRRKNKSITNASHHIQTLVSQMGKQ